MKLKHRNDQVGDASAANEKTEQELIALVPPDPHMSAAACGALKVEARACGRGEGAKRT